MGSAGGSKEGEEVGRKGVYLYRVVLADEDLWRPRSSRREGLRLSGHALRFFAR